LVETIELAASDTVGASSSTPPPEPPPPPPMKLPSGVVPD
jgi:hypothetical protein